MTATTQNVISPAGLAVTYSSALTSGQLESSVSAWLARSWSLPPQFPFVSPTDRLKTAGRIYSADGNLRTAQRARYRVSEYANFSPAVDSAPFRIRRTTRNIDTGETGVDYINFTVVNDPTDPGYMSPPWVEVGAPTDNRTILLEQTAIEDSDDNAAYRVYSRPVLAAAVFPGPDDGG